MIIIQNGIIDVLVGPIIIEDGVKLKNNGEKIGKRRMKSDVNCLIDKYLNEEVK